MSSFFFLKKNYHTQALENQKNKKRIEKKRQRYCPKKIIIKQRYCPKIKKKAIG